MNRNEQQTFSDVVTAYRKQQTEALPHNMQFKKSHSRLLSYLAVDDQMLHQRQSLTK